MRHIIRDCLIYFIDCSGLSFLYRVSLRTKSPLVRIVAFHDVPDAQWFETTIGDMAKHYHILTPEQFHTKEFNQKKINVLLTFDDGYQSWLDVCMPVLARYNLKGLFFINSGLLDCAGDTAKVALYMKERLFISPKDALTWESAQILHASGHTLGGHSVTHSNLASLAEDVLQDEIEADKKRIEEKLQIRVVDFAYPFGTKRDYTKNVIATVQQAGYLYQYSAQTGFVTNNSVPIPRILIERNQSLLSINRWIRGGYDIFSRMLCK